MHDEVGRLLEGTEDVLVPMLFQAEPGGFAVRTVLNDWLDQATDTDLDALLDDWVTASYELLVPFYADQDTEVYDVLTREFIDTTVNMAHVRAWLAHHRPTRAE